MRSAESIPGEPWPHDMVLTISEDDQGLLDLLWVREAWALSPGGDVPPPPEALPAMEPTVESLRRDRTGWEAAWTELWSATLEHVARPHDPFAMEALRATENGSEERRRLLQKLIGPSWRARFGDGAFVGGYDGWTAAISRLVHAEHRLSLHEHPERHCLDALVPAWERGLTTVVTIPCTGDWTRTIGAHGLCVTRAARTGPDRYRTALAAFAP